MRKIFLCFGIVLIVTMGINAQSITKTPPQNIMEALSIVEDGLGIVKINQPNHIKSLVESPIENVRGILSNDGSVYTMKGYRIQIYNGNMPNSKSEAYSRSEKIKNKFDTLGCYITYKAPFWRLLVGDFTNESEAKDMLDIIGKELPQYKREMYVVPSKIRVVPNSFNY